MSSIDDLDRDDLVVRLGSRGVTSPRLATDVPRWKALIVVRDLAGAAAAGLFSAAGAHSRPCCIGSLTQATEGHDELEVFTFDRAEHEVTGDGSVGLHATRIAQFAANARATCLALAPGGRIGTHPASSHQVLLIVAGSGWVTGHDEARVPVTAGQAAYWAPDELHTTGSDTGLTAIALEGGPVTIFEPEAR